MRQHPVAPALAVRQARFAANHARALEGRQREFGSADIHGERVHLSGLAEAGREHFLQGCGAGSLLHDRNRGGQVSEAGRLDRGTRHGQRQRRARRETVARAADVHGLLHRHSFNRGHSPRFYQQGAFAPSVTTISAVSTCSRSFW